MKISDAILSVLAKSGQVGLPGFGLLKKNRSAGYFNSDDGSFHPPKESFHFQEDEYADSLELVEALNIGYQSEGAAKIALDQYVEDLKEELQDKKEAEIEGLGKFYDTDGRISFLQSEEANIGFFGLPSVYIQDLKEEDGEETIIAPVDLETQAPVTDGGEESAGFIEEPVDASSEETSAPVHASGAEDKQNQTSADATILAEKAVEKLISLEDVEILPMAAEEHVVEKKSKSKLWLYILLPILIIGIILAGIYFLRPDLYQKILDQISVEKEKVGVVQTPPVLPNPELSADSAIADSIYNADIEANLAKSGLEYEKVKDTADITVEQHRVPNASSTRYEIVIAAWKSMSAAERHVKTLKAKGIAAHIVEKDADTWKRVSVGSFDNMDAAKAELPRIKKEINKEARITTVRN